MNDAERLLLRQVVRGELKQAQETARIILDKITAQKDQAFKANLLKDLDDYQKKVFELPYNMRDLLAAEDVSNFHVARFLLRQEESSAVQKIIAAYKAAAELQKRNIRYTTSALFYGESGTGKTELARYIAYKLNLPFIYVRFSSLVNSLLGGTQTNIGKVFGYARTVRCVLCFDEIDAIGMKRGDAQDVSEMSRATIALLQELDALPNDVIVLATTNRYDRLDPALKRRFSIEQEIKPLNEEQCLSIVKMFFACAGISESESADMVKSISIAPDHSETAASITQKCTEAFVEYLIQNQASIE